MMILIIDITYENVSEIRLQEWWQMQDHHQDQEEVQKVSSGQVFCCWHEKGSWQKFNF